MIWTEEQVKKLQQLIYQLNVASLDEMIYNEDTEHGEGTAKIEFLATNEVEENIDAKFTREALQKFVHELRPREYDVIMLRFGLDGEGYRTLQEVGEMFGMTRERIRQIESKALLHLRHILKNAGINNRSDI